MICTQDGTQVEEILREACRTTFWGEKVWFKIDYLGLQGVYGEEPLSVLTDTILGYIEEYTAPVESIYIADVEIGFSKVNIKISLKEETV